MYLPKGPEQVVEQAMLAVQRAWQDGVKRQSLELLLPLIGATDLDDWCCSLLSLLATAGCAVHTVLATVQACLCIRRRVRRAKQGCRSYIIKPWSSMYCRCCPTLASVPLMAPCHRFYLHARYTVSALCRPVGVPQQAMMELPMVEARTTHICLVVNWSNRPLVLTAARRRPGGVRQQAKAAIPMVESMLRELKQRPELQGPLQGEVIDQVQL